MFWRSSSLPARAWTLSVWKAWARKPPFARAATHSRSTPSRRAAAGEGEEGAGAEERAVAAQAAAPLEATTRSDFACAFYQRRGRRRHKRCRRRHVDGGRRRRRGARIFSELNRLCACARESPPVRARSNHVTSAALSPQARCRRPPPRRPAARAARQTLPTWAGRRGHHCGPRRRPSEARRAHWQQALRRAAG